MQGTDRHRLLAVVALMSLALPAVADADLAAAFRQGLSQGLNAAGCTRENATNLLASSDTAERERGAGCAQLLAKLCDAKGADLPSQVCRDGSAERGPRPSSI